ncbi:hypothetical protein ACFY7Z_29495 [Streptomyces sp. NPDC012623]|uniref:hypothetical protein n=1 Tax=unclassified Streptomyces TaxID=2593676 RepID=UPI0036CB970B
MLAHPLLHGRELVPSEPHRLHPPPRILARRGGRRLARVQVRWKHRCHITGHDGRQDASISSNCSRRSSDSAPADDFTGSPSARRCSVSCAFRAAARAFFNPADPTTPIPTTD